MCNLRSSSYATDSHAIFHAVLSLQINVLVDTGSSNFAVAASPHPYLPFYYHTDKWVAGHKTRQCRIKGGNYKIEAKTVYTVLYIDNQNSKIITP